MDLAFDLDGSTPGRIGETDFIRIAHPRWPDLLARLAAAREASASLARQIRNEPIAMQGSFDDATAAWVAALAFGRRSVNPIALGNRKSGGAIASPVAGNPRTGGRG